MFLNHVVNRFGNYFYDRLPAGHQPSLKQEGVLTTANAADTNSLTCLPKHGGARDNIFLVTHPMTGLCEHCLGSAIARRAQ
jgi:hypothetical protein